MEDKKYIILQDEEHTTTYEGRVLHRIQAIRDFGDIQAGDIGGWVQRWNLSHHGDCWIHDDAMAMDNAFIRDDAQMYGAAKAMSNAVIYDNAVVEEYAKITGYVGGNAVVGGNACITYFDEVESNDEFLVFEFPYHEIGTHITWVMNSDQFNCGQYWGKADWFLEQLHAHCRKHSKTNPNAPRYAGRIVEMVEDIKKMREEDIEPKYEILYHFPQVLDRNGQKLYRIRALKDIPNPRRRVKEGDIGGYIWGEHNLSQVGNCWVFDDAKVYELGRLEDHATAHDNAQIFECSDLCENAVIHENAKAYGDSYMVGESEIRGTAEITDFAVMYECSRAYDNAKIFDWAHMMGDSSVCDNAHVYGHSIITGNARIVGNASVGGLSEIGMMSVVHENEIVIDEHIFEI